MSCVRISRPAGRHRDLLPVPLHAQQCFAYLGHSPEDFPHSLAAAAEVLALPIYPELAAEQREYVVRQIAEFYRA